MRAVLALLIVASCASCAEPAQPVAVARPAPAPAPSLSDCRTFTAPAMEAGAAHRASGTACLQPDGRWLIVAERPLPAAEIAWASPVPAEAEPDTMVYYPFDPRNHQASLFDGGCCGGWSDDGWRGFSGGHRHRGRHAFGGFRRGGFGP